MLADTHTHLYLEQFNDDIDEVVKRATDAGVQRFFLPNINSATIGPMMRLAETYPEQCFPMMGLHPCSVKENFEEELAVVEDRLLNDKFYAVGETGIDLHWDSTYLEQQEKAFRRQVELAKRLGLPIVIHVRKSFNEVLNVVDELNDDKLRGVFHCFSGTLEQARHITGYGGFKIGIGGVVTFKNSGLGEVVEHTGLEHIVLETDSPYLAPAPHRGKRNESGYLRIIAEKVAEIKGLPLEEVARITTASSKEIFGI